jgi:AMP-binding enzyme C-terminal domain
MLLGDILELKTRCASRIALRWSPATVRLRSVSSAIALGDSRRQWPSWLRRAPVIGLPDPLWGERVTALVALRPGASATTQEIIAACRDRLAGFKTPRDPRFVNELPENVSGKILKRELREHFGDA